MRSLDAENALPNDTVLLLSEVEEMLDAATHIVVQPCDCRRLGQNCDRPVETCVWLDDGALAALDRGYGRRLTREEAKELARWADKKGLMHTADSEWQTRGLHAICNCCACDCYPFRAAQELGSQGVWPRSRYVAVRDGERCNLCGACVQRCHFEAFHYSDELIEVGDKLKENVVFDPDRCWGCGLCANTCPSAAIVMVPLL
jgi:ferredoxin